ncbi:unnamed protein product [Vitrella brassicaformis CCMP3155]|uniref:Uncharacterized protein n=1 Tax=Vitrella brassicaformis (strain CCMP3155) TaxID=1169540 RepID=A0A0G4GI02_VITBC|nr:unnamed protein product [Vitrella brassicaformis CCMP3155]|eukprot:CEM29377.1 unnamed protein product [Vitrella brassicaformis CCMP3155]
MASGQKGQDPAVVQRLQELEKERHDIIMKMQELEQQRSEHRLVIQAFENLAAELEGSISRRCLQPRRSAAADSGHVRAGQSDSAARCGIPSGDR